MRSMNLYIFLSLLFTWPARAEISELTWPLGELTCLGRWTFQEIKQCQVTDPNLPLYEGPPTYPLGNKTCGSWNFGEEVLEPKEMSISIDDRTSIRNQADVESWCRYQAKPTISVDGILNYWKDGQFLPDRITQKWVLRNVRIEGSVGYCQLELVNQPVQANVMCGVETDYTRPSPSFSGYGTKLVYDQVACGSDSRTLAPGESVATLQTLDNVAKQSFSCSTQDQAQLNSKEEVLAKASILNKELLAALRLDNAQCGFILNLTEYTRLFLAKKIELIPASQQSILSSINKILEKKCLIP